METTTTAPRTAKKGTPHHELAGILGLHNVLIILGFMALVIIFNLLKGYPWASGLWTALGVALFYLGLRSSFYKAFRCYLASKAPQDVPGWFQEDDIPKAAYPKLPLDARAIDKRAVYDWHRGDEMDELPQHLHWYRDEFLAAQRYNSNHYAHNQHMRVYLWRFYWADQILERRAR